MNASESEMSDVQVNTSNSSTRKKRKTGREHDATKRLRDSTHETGEDCHCKQLKCFENINETERYNLISTFNTLGNRDAQNSYLAGLISVKPVQRRRPKKSLEEARLNDFSYEYKVRVVRNEKVEELRVCFTAFKSIFGVTNRRLQTVKFAITTTGKAPIDKRGTHKNRPHKISDEVHKAMMDFFGSLKGRKAHYSLKDSNKVYLPENLNVKKLLALFLQKYNTDISYEKFRQTFVENFNISFGYPRTDTCATCDEQKVKELSIETSLEGSIGENKAKLEKELKDLQTTMKIHKVKASWFYKRKRDARRESRKSVKTEAIVVDYGRNLQVPDISTSEVYFRRQLSFYVFNVHVLATGVSVFYTYDQTEGKKGSDDVVSMLDHFIHNFLDPSVEELNIFCDGCSGQNKNYTMLRYFHYMTVEKKRFNELTITFPVRGHSYMESDKNMGLIPRRSAAETPSDWRDVIQSARVKPSPFEVVAFERRHFKEWGKFLSSKYTKKFSEKTRPIREVRVTQSKSRTIDHRSTYTGAFTSTVVTPRVKSHKKNLDCQQLPLQLPTEPEASYPQPIPISKAKYDDLQVLKKFCRVDAQEFYTSLPHSQQHDHETQDDEDYID